jgi:hypothetical protein
VSNNPLKHNLVPGILQKPNQLALDTNPYRLTQYIDESAKAPSNGRIPKKKKPTKNVQKKVKNVTKRAKEYVQGQANKNVNKLPKKYWTKAWKKRHKWRIADSIQKRVDSEEAERNTANK